MYTLVLFVPFLGMTRVFQTYPGERVVVQLGAADAVSALAAASVVARDCRAIDLNMGCPKLFSLQGNVYIQLNLA